MTADTIHWPAIVHYDNDAELAYVASLQQWLDDAELSGFDYQAEDELIDSHGNVFLLQYKSDTLVRPVASGRSKTLQQVLGLVKAHLSEQGSCCVAKLSAYSIAEAIALLNSPANCSL